VRSPYDSTLLKPAAWRLAAAVLGSWPMTFGGYTHEGEADAEADGPELADALGPATGFTVMVLELVPVPARFPTVSVTLYVPATV
jgi:hypothetical protein